MRPGSTSESSAAGSLYSLLVVGSAPGSAAEGASAASAVGPPKTGVQAKALARVHAEVVDPAAVAVVADHRGGNQHVVLEGAEHGLGAVEVGVRIVPRAREPGGVPEGDGRVAILRGERADHAFTSFIVNWEVTRPMPGSSASLAM